MTLDIPVSWFGSPWVGVGLGAIAIILSGVMAAMAIKLREPGYLGPPVFGFLIGGAMILFELDQLGMVNLT